MKYKTETFITWLNQAFFTVINMKVNGAVHQRHQKKSVYANYTVNQTISHLILHGMIIILSSINLEPLDVIYTPSPHIIKKSYERKQEGSFVGYTYRISTMKWWYLYTNKLKYVSSANFDKHNNKFSKTWAQILTPFQH